MMGFPAALAMAAGLTTLKLISRPGFHDELTEYTARLLQGLQERADAAGIQADKLQGRLQKP